MWEEYASRLRIGRAAERPGLRSHAERGNEGTIEASSSRWLAGRASAGFFFGGV